MRIAIVNAQDLGNDWRAEAHVEPLEEDFKQARIAGWESGARGARNITSAWAKHGREEVRIVFREAYEAGVKARRAFLKEEE